jgi:hypothetical protein
MSPRISGRCSRILLYVGVQLLWFTMCEQIPLEKLLALLQTAGDGGERIVCVAAD